MYKSKNLKLLILFIVFVLIASLSLFSCKEEAPASEEEIEEAPASEEEIEEAPAVATKPFEGVTLNLLNMLGWTVTEDLIKIIPEFEETTGIKVVVNDKPYEEIVSTTIKEGEASSGVFDIVENPADQLSSTSRYLLSLDDLIHNNFGLDEWKDNYINPGIDSVIIDGEIKAIPFQGNIQVGGYRKQLFEDPKEQANFKEKYGYDLKPPTTYEELIDVAQFFTRDTNNDGETDQWGLLIPGSGGQGIYLFYEQLYRAGIQGYINEDKEFTFGEEPNRSKVIYIAQFNQDLIYKYKVTPPGITGMQYPELVEMYVSGEGAMIMSWLADNWIMLNSPEVKEKIGETGSFIPPNSDPNGFGFIGFWAWAIPKDSKNPEAAFEFIKWATSLDTAKKWLPNTKATFIPPQIDVQNWTLTQEGLVIPAQIEASDNTKGALPWPEISIIMADAQVYYESLLGNSITPEEFVDNVTMSAKDALGE